jgi:hypothetical protein
MATAPADGNRVGAIIQSMFARIKNLWVGDERQNPAAESSDWPESFAQRRAQQGRRQLRCDCAEIERYRSAVNAPLNLLDLPTAGCPAKTQVLR